jgi:hypothetical protein
MQTTSPNSTSNSPQSSVKTHTFEGLHLQILVVLGIAYGRDCPTAAQRGLGAELSQQAIIVGPDEWSASPGRKDLTDCGRKTAGVYLTRSRNKHGAGEKRREQWFFPYEDLDRLSVSLSGVKIA